MSLEDSPQPSDFLVVIITAPNTETAHALAHTLVGERLAACVTQIPAVRSTYWWEGKICDEEEILCVAKAPAAGFEALRARVLAIHPYQVPEIVAWPLAAGHADYLAWLKRETLPQGPR